MTSLGAYMPRETPTGHTNRKKTCNGIADVQPEHRIQDVGKYQHVATGWLSGFQVAQLVMEPIDFQMGHFSAYRRA
jgi:hypothetical protein